MLKPFMYYGSQLVSIRYPSSIMGIIIYCKGRMKLPLTPDGQWPRIVKVVLVHSYGSQNNDKVKEPVYEVAVLP